MDVKELLESYGKILKQINEVRRDLDLCEKYQEGDENEKAYWKERSAIKKEEEGKLVREADNRRRMIRRKLQKLPETIQREVLSMRYLDCIKFTQISKQKQFSSRHIFRIHRQAIDLLQQLEAETDENRGAATA